MESTAYVQMVEASTRYILREWQKSSRNKFPDIAVILGSGFKEAAQKLNVFCELPFSEIPYAPVPGVIGHGGALLLGELSGIPCAMLTGRVHLYEGHSPNKVVHMLRAVGKAGATKVLLSNACGSLRKEVEPGTLVAITDQMNFTATSCLSGEGRLFGGQFVDMSQAYEKDWVEAIVKKSSAKKGVYVGLHGGAFESPAETRAYAMLGGDVVGMSTVHETIAAKQLQMRVAGLSFVSNYCGGLVDEVNHVEVLALAQTHQKTLSEAIVTTVGIMSNTH